MVLGRFFVGLAALIFRRGTGVLKFVFAVDDLFRLFTMTLVFFLGLNLLGVSGFYLWLGSLVGLVIDIHDIFDDISSGKPIDLGFN